MIDSKLVIHRNTTLVEALRIMDEARHKLLVICDNEMEFVGLITIGDIQRALLAKTDLSSKVDKYIRSDIVYASEKTPLNEVKEIMQNTRMEYMPVIAKGKLTDIIFWEDIILGKKPSTTKQINYPVVIMAGGEGTRLRPLTNILPKPLIPISEKTIIEEVMDLFGNSGCRNFTISLNYKADTIREYFQTKHLKDYDIQFIQEKEPLGTAGSLYLLKDMFDSSFFVSNCDMLIDVDLHNLYEYHSENRNVVTIVSVLKNYSLPYGALETIENGVLTSIKEKPDIVYQVNSGLYLLEPEVFHYIVDGEFIHITEVIERIMNDGKRVGVFPISEGSWVDMGNWDEYMKLIQTRNNKD